MPSVKVKPYLGSDPYIFISYAHADKEKVYPIIEELDKRGYRLWYDEGIEPGSEWIKEIARRISGSEMVLFFLSHNFLESYHCDKELRFSAGKEKEYIPAFIEQLELPEDIEYLISSEQHVFRYEYAELQDFLDKLCSSRAMERCLEIREEAEVIVPTEVKKPDRRKEEVQPHRHNRKLPLLLACLFLSALLLISIPKLFGPQNEVIYNKDLKVTGEYVTADFLEKTTQEEELRSIEFVGCTFADGVASSASLPVGIHSLHFSNCSGIDSLQFISGLMTLEELTLSGCGLTDDILQGELPNTLNVLSLSNNPKLSEIAPLGNLQNLDRLDLSNTGTTSLSALEGLDLHVLDFSNTGITDITPLKNIDTLTVITGSDTAVRDISMLVSLEKLKTIRFDRCQIESPKEAFRSLRLEVVSLADNKLSNLDILENCTVLKHVDLSGNQLTCIDNLHKSEATLEYLDLSGNPLTPGAYSSIEDFHQLKELYLDNIFTHRLVSCDKMGSLKRLSAAGCGISELSIYSKGFVLDYLCLANNRITNGQWMISWKVSDSCTMDLSNNPLKELIYLRDGPYDVLMLVGDEMDTDTISRTVKGKLLVIDSGLELTKRLDKDAFQEYAILNCPMDERIRVEEYFGAGTVTFLDDMTELIEFLDQRNINHWLSAQSEITR